jgi:hypothetical protein
MDLTGWERLFKLWHKEYYINFFVLICIVTALVTAIKFHQKDKLYRYFYFYIISAFALFTLCDLVLIILNLKGRAYSFVIESVNICFAFIEYLLFYNFFFAVLKSKIAKKLMTIFIPFLALATILFAIKSRDHNFSIPAIIRYADLTISAELLFLGSLCIIYYYELLRKKPIVNLQQSPSFWIVSGLFFYCIVISPFVIHYITFGILFLAITKAFLCKKQLTT